MRLPAALLVAAAVPAVVLAAVDGKNLGAVRGGDWGDAGKVMDDRCLSCHNRGRIEKALEQRRDMERLTKEMEKKGAVLTDRDREVLQHFWKAKAFRK